MKSKRHFHVGQNSSIANTSHFVKDPEADYYKIIELLKHPDTKCLETTKAAYKVIGDRGHVGFWIGTPMVGLNARSTDYDDGYV